MDKQVNVPAHSEDRDKFKTIAAKRRKSMKELFHEVVQDLPEVNE